MICRFWLIFLWTVFLTFSIQVFKDIKKRIGVRFILLFINICFRFIRDEQNVFILFMRRRLNEVNFNLVKAVYFTFFTLHDLFEFHHILFHELLSLFLFNIDLFIFNWWRDILSYFYFLIFYILLWFILLYILTRIFYL